MARAGLTGVAQALTGWEREIGEALEEVVEDHAARVAAEARADHPYTDRTGNLTASIEALPAQGSVRGGDLRATVVAGEEYASYVDSGRFRYLLPAAERVEGELADAADRALAAATTR